MEGHSRYSEKKHDLFLERFKGKVSRIDKNGFIDIVSNSKRPIEKNLRASTELFIPKTNQAHDNISKAFILKHIRLC